MGIKDRKEREQQEKRKAILEAARELFLKDGYDKTSIRNIAEKIEYSPGTIYQYFQDKDDIFFEIHFQAFQDLLAQMDEACHFENPLENLYAIGKVYMSFALQNPELYDLMFIMRAPMCSLANKKATYLANLQNKPKPDMDNLLQWQEGFEAYLKLKKIMQACINQGLIRYDDVDLATFTMWANVHGMMSLYIRDRLHMIPQTHQIPMMEASLKCMIELIKK